MADKTKHSDSSQSVATKPISQTWRTKHDYNGDNDKQVCSKCGRTLLAQNQKFPPTREWTDRKPVCPKKDTSSLKQLLRTKSWYGFLPKSYFYQSIKPYTVIVVNLEDLL